MRHGEEGEGRLKVDTAFRQVMVSVQECTGKHFPFPVAPQPNSGLGRLSVEVSRSDTTGRTPMNKRSARRTGHYLQNTQQTQGTTSMAVSGIRTCNQKTPQTARPPELE